MTPFERILPSLLPILMLLSFAAGVTFLRFNANPKIWYTENVCTYKGGEIKDDVCVVNDRVVRIDEP